MTQFKSKRTKASDIFEVDELYAIIKHEAKRPIVENKRQNINVNFSTVIAWLNYLNVPTKIFADEISIEEIFNEGKLMHSILPKKTLTKLNDVNFRKIISDVTGYLSANEPLQKSDYILVFGGTTLDRVDHAVNLYLNKWAPKIIMSGHGPIYGKSKISEAEIFKNRALILGAPESDIITENKAITIADNIRRTLNLLDETGATYSRIILVISWYAQRRAWMMADKFVSDKVSLINSCVKLENSHRLSQDNWYKTEFGIQIIFNEFLKMRIHHHLVINKII